MRRMCERDAIHQQISPYTEEVSAPVSITLFGKPGCHLCDDARAVITGVRAELETRGIATSLDEVNILDDVALARKYSEDIPVVQVAGKRIAVWRVDPVRLTAAVERAAKRAGWSLIHTLRRG